MDPQQFMADHKGSCVACHDVKRLDEMIKKTERGYECVDCVAIQEAESLENKGLINLEGKTQEEKITLIKKAMRWCFG